MKTIKLLCRIRITVILSVIFFCFSCATISSFDQYAYAQTTSLKVDALNMMDFAIDEYVTQERNVHELQIKLQKAYEYEKNRPKNEITLQLWDLLLDPDGHLLGGFLKRWENEQKLGETFIKEEKKLVDKAFDQIAGLESNKLKTKDVSK